MRRVLIFSIRNKIEMITSFSITSLSITSLSITMEEQTVYPVDHQLTEKDLQFKYTTLDGKMHGDMFVYKNGHLFRHHIYKRGILQCAFEYCGDGYSPPDTLHRVLVPYEDEQNELEVFTEPYAYIMYGGHKSRYIVASMHDNGQICSIDVYGNGHILYYVPTCLYDEDGVVVKLVFDMGGRWSRRKPLNSSDPEYDPRDWNSYTLCK